MKKKIILLLYPIIFLFFFLGFPLPAHASLLDNLVNGVKNFISPSPMNLSTENKTNTSAGILTVDSKITLAKNGDFNKDESIEGGNMVTFSYAINNDTNTNYRFVTLKTNIPRKLLYYFQNMKGVFSIEEKDGSMEIPNLYIPAHQHLNINFDAHILYFSDGDKTLGTQAQLMGQNGQKFAEAKEFHVKAKSLDINKLHGLNAGFKN